MKNPVLRTSHKIAYSSGNLPIYLMQQMVATFIVFFYVDHLGVRPGLISIAMVVHGLINAGIHPLLGHLSDKTRTRWGRRVPYIMFGMIPLSAAFTLMWIPLVSEANLFWYFLGIIVVFDLAFVTVALNWTSLFPEMFSKLRDRSFVSTWRQIWGIIGMILGIASPPLLYTTIGWGSMAVIFGIIVLFFWALSLSGVKESYQPSSEGLPFLKALRFTLTNKAFVAFVIGNFLVQLVFAILPGAAPFFAKYVLMVPESQTSFILGAIFIVALPFVYVWGKFINHWGPRTIALASVATLMISLIPFFFVQTFAGSIATALGIGIGLAGVLVVLDILLADVVDEDAIKTGFRREGMFFGINGFIGRGSASIQAAIMGAILEISGYISNAAVQPESAVFGIRMMISGIPMVILLIVFICFYIYPIRQSPQKDMSEFASVGGEK